VEGTGIGLTITKRLVELMNGSVGFENKLGGGTKFQVDLPIYGTEINLKPETYDDSDANLGLEIATAQLPDMILMDINLPGKNGVEALQYLKASENRKQIPLNAMKKDIERALVAGFDAYLTKPIEMNKLLDTIKRFISCKI
jgi:CheY-like chemotaxis protein